MKIRQLKEFSRQNINSADLEARYALTTNSDVTPVIPTPEGMMLVLIEKRTPPTAAEKQSLKDTLTAEFQSEKRALAESAFLNWVRANTESYMSGDQQQ